VPTTSSNEALTSGIGTNRTNRTNRADLMMSVPRGNPEVAFRGGQERF
jgi:hypothetical protein